MPSFVQAHGTSGLGAQSKSAGSTLTVVNLGVAAGSTLIAVIASDNTSAVLPTLSSLSKPGGESASWTITAGAATSSTAAAGVRVAVARIDTTIAWPAGGTDFLFTLSASVTAKAAVVLEFTSVGAFINVGTSGNSAGGTPTASLVSGDTRAGGLIVGVGGWETSAALTADSDTTNGSWSSAFTNATSGSTADTNIRAYAQYKITSAAGAQSFNPAGANDANSMLLSFDVPAAITANPDGIATGEALGTPAATIPITAVPDGIATGEALGSPTATLGAGGITATPDGIASAVALGTPDATLPITAVPDGIASGENMGSPAMTSALTAVPDGIGSLVAVGTPAATLPITAVPDGIPTAAALGDPEATVSNPGITARPDGIASSVAMGTPDATLPIEAVPDGIGSAVAVGPPVVLTSLVASPDGIASEEAIGEPGALLTLTAVPDGIASEVVLGEPFALLVLVAVPDGIPSEAALGTPRWVLPPRDITVEVVSVSLSPAVAHMTQHPATVEDVSGHPARVVRMEI